MAFDFSMMLPQGGIINPGSEGMSPEQNKMMMLGLLSNAFTNIGNLGAGRPQESFMPGLLSMQTMFNNQNQKAGKAKKLQEAFKGATVNDPVAGYGVGGNWSQDPATAQFMAQQAQDVNALGGQEAPSIMPEVKPYGPPRLDMSKAMQNLMDSGDPDLMMAGFENQLKLMPEATKPQLVTVYGEDGKPIFKDVTSQVLKTIATHEFDAIVCIGGDGTMHISNDLFKDGVPIVGIPKTIDNDLKGTDITFGFDSALGIATDAIDRLHTTANSHKRIMVIELMGHNAGWLTLFAGIAGGGDVILLPEIRYDLDIVADYLVRRANSKKPYSIVVVGEGIEKPKKEKNSAPAMSPEDMY